MIERRYLNRTRPHPRLKTIVRSEIGGYSVIIFDSFLRNWLNLADKSANVKVSSVKPTMYALKAATMTSAQHSGKFVDRLQTKKAPT